MDGRRRTRPLALGLAIVLGASPARAGTALVRPASVQRALAKPRCSVLHLDRGGEETVRVALALLPETERVVFGGLNADGAGRRFTSRDALDLVAALANAPVFVNVSAFVGRGVVGGAVVDLATVGRLTGDAVIRQLRGEPAAAAPEINARSLVFDGRALDRWGLSESALPEGSQALSRPPTIWEQHRRAVLAGVTVAVLQSVVIAGLLLEWRRRRKAEAGLRRLSTRLMTAQEDERRRIARDLHDDVCQRLVLMAVDLDLVESGSAHAGRTAVDVAEAARALSADVQRIAYRLHPASLDRLGLLPAAERFAREAAARAGLAIETKSEDWPQGELPRDVSLVLYRVMQEALQNVFRHSGASRARVVFRGIAGGVSVRVEDDGRGFDALQVGETGLGFVGMHERLLLYGGHLSVESAPGEGSIVEAWLPAKAVRPMPASCS